MAFRILRINGYNVNPEGDHYFDSISGHMNDINAALELFRASETVVYPDESAQDRTNSWSRKFLKQELSNESIYTNKFMENVKQEVDDAIKFPFWANLARLENRRYIGQYDVDNTRILKTSYCSPNISNEDFLKLAVEDFNICQSKHRDELKDLKRWIEENRLYQLKFARQTVGYCYFSAAATLFSPELSDARISWAKYGVLTTAVDDFYDVGGSEEEQINLIQLVEKWDVNMHTDCCSDQVKILFAAIRSSVCESVEKAITWQGRDVTSHMVEMIYPRLEYGFDREGRYRSSCVKTDGRRTYSLALVANSSIDINIDPHLLFSLKENDGSLKLQLKDLALEFSWPLERIRDVLRDSVSPIPSAPMSCSPESHQLLGTLVEEHVPESKIGLASGVLAFLWLYTNIQGYKPATVVITSELPLGSGLGSSAAF